MVHFCRGAGAAVEPYVKVSRTENSFYQQTQCDVYWICVHLHYLVSGLLGLLQTKRSPLVAIKSTV